MYYAVENGKRKPTICEGEKMELVRYFGYGNVFDTMADAQSEIDKRNTPPEKKYSWEEHVKLYKEQYKFAWSQMTETEKKWARERKKSLEQEQLEYGRMMMRLETAY